MFLCEPDALELVGLVLRLLLEAARPRRQLVLLLAALAPRVERHLAHLKMHSCSLRNTTHLFLFPMSRKFKYKQSISFTMISSGIWKSVTISNSRLLTLSLYPIIFTKRSIGKSEKSHFKQ